MTETNKKTRILKGVIVSDKMNKTAVVSIVRLKKHPKYKKYFKVTEKFKAHDEKNEYLVGDRVLIEETRPLSKDKRWRIIGKLYE
ncbi:MAG: 30S ribosomal protein S17 [Parcubacteria group bacterium]|nr:30S ribosomal protein S17 [Parcubacteria group bacterium]